MSGTIYPFNSWWIIQMPFDIVEGMFTTTVKEVIKNELDEIAPGKWTLGAICQNIYVDLWFDDKDSALKALFFIRMRYYSAEKGI